MFFIRLLSRLPLSVLYVFSDLLFLASFYGVGYRKRLVKKNLKNSFPEKGAAELKQIEKDFYRNLCDYAVEMVKLISMPAEELSRRMKFTNPEIPEHYKAEGQSIIFLAAHQFNWEWLLLSASISFPMPIDFVYQPINSGFFDKLMLFVRTRFGAYAIRRDEVARELVRRRGKLRGLASVADQYPGYGHDKKFIATFLNQETAFFMGTNQLALLTQYPVIYYKIRKIRRGYYEGTAVPVASPPYAKTSDAVIANYVTLVENAIRENPAGWLWSHNRWKKRHLRKKANKV